MADFFERRFTGRIKDVILTSDNNNGKVVPIINWAEEMKRFTPKNAVNPTYEIYLESLQANARLQGLLKTPFPAVTNDLDEIEQRLILEQHKHKYTPEEKFSIELSLWGKRNTTSNWSFLAAEYLYNNSLIFYLPLLYPYLIAEQVSTEDVDYQLGIAISRGQLPDGNAITIRGGYRGTAYYELSEITNELNESAGGVVVGNSLTKVIPSNSNRKLVYVCNNGTTDLFFRFTWQNSQVKPNFCPFLKPGGALTLTTNDLNYEGGNQQHFLKEAIQFFIRYPLVAVRASGSGVVCWQEFYS